MDILNDFKDFGFSIILPVSLVTIMFVMALVLLFVFKRIIIHKISIQILETTPGGDRMSDKEMNKTFGKFIFKIFIMLLVVVWIGGIAYIIIPGSAYFMIAIIVPELVVLTLPIKDVVSNRVAYFEMVIVNKMCKVGDWISITDQSGKEFQGGVEEMFMSNLKLRGIDGAVMFARYNDIKTLINYTYQWSYAIIVVESPYDEDFRNIFSILNEIDGELKVNESMKENYMNEVHKDGMIEVDGHSYKIRYRFKSKAGSQWAVGNFVRILLTDKFQRAGIKAVPTEVKVSDPREYKKEV